MLCACASVLHFVSAVKKCKSYLVVQNRTQNGKSSLFIVAGCGLPSCWACFDWDRGVRLPHISFSSLRGINHPVKSRQFYSVVCESAYNPHNSTAHLRPMYPNVQLNKQNSWQLGIPSQLQWPKRSFTKTFSLIKSFQFWVVGFFVFCCACLTGLVEYKDNIEVVKTMKQRSETVTGSTIC